MRYHVIDEDLAFSFFCETREGADACEAGIELLGHVARVRSIPTKGDA